MNLKEIRKEAFYYKENLKAEIQKEAERMSAKTCAALESESKKRLRQ